VVTFRIDACSDTHTPTSGSPCANAFTVARVAKASALAKATQHTQRIGTTAPVQHSARR
jgi:hypothetical protein